MPSSSLPAEAPELCSAEFHPPGDSRIVIGRAGSVVCYFRSTAEMLGAIDVHLDVPGEIHATSYNQFSRRRRVAGESVIGSVNRAGSIGACAFGERAMEQQPAIATYQLNNSAG